MVHFMTADHAEALNQYGLTGRDTYGEASKEVAAFLGYEFAHEDRPQRQEELANVFGYMNEQGNLGLDIFDKKMLPLFYTMLSESRRFNHDATIDLHKGENPATHSLQTVAVKERVFDKVVKQDVLQRRLGAHTPLDAYRFTQHSQLAGLGLIAHDMGEVLGEFTTAVQRWNSDGKLGEDPLAERKVFEFVLRLAIGAVQANDAQRFFDEVARLRGVTQLADENGGSRGVPKTADELQALLQPPVPLDEAGEAKAVEWMALWDLAERGEDPANRLHQQWKDAGANLGFLQQLIKSCDHVQGTRHMIRMARRGNAAEHKDERNDLAHVDAKRVMGNFYYDEGEVGRMFSAIDANDRTLDAIARQQASLVYDTQKDLADIMPPTALGYQMIRTGNPMIDAAQPAVLPDAPTPREIKLAQGKLCGLYERARDAVAAGEFTPDLVEDGKGGMRSRMLAVDGVTQGQAGQLYARASRGVA